MEISLIFPRLAPVLAFNQPLPQKAHLFLFDSVRLFAIAPLPLVSYSLELWCYQRKFGMPSHEKFRIYFFKSCLSSSLQSELSVLSPASNIAANMVRQKLVSRTWLEFERIVIHYLTSWCASCDWLLLWISLCTIFNPRGQKFSSILIAYHEYARRLHLGYSLEVKHYYKGLNFRENPWWYEWQVTEKRHRERTYRLLLSFLING